MGLVGNVGDWLADAWLFIFHLQAGAWAAIAAWVAVLVGALTILVTGRYAKQQIEEARKQSRQAEQDRAAQAREAEAARRQQADDAFRLREEQARPNVVAFMEPDPSHWGFVDFVVKNFGLTAAYRIEIEADPELEVAPFVSLSDGTRVTHLAYPKTIPMLAPGQEWRTAWDYIRGRNTSETALTGQYSIEVTFETISGKRYSSPSVLDWEILNHKSTVTTKTFHDFATKMEQSQSSIVDNLAEVAKAVSRITGEHSGVWVYPVDASEEREHRRRESEEADRRSADAVRYLRSLAPPIDGESAPPVVDSQTIGPDAAPSED